MIDALIPLDDGYIEGEWVQCWHCGGAGVYEHDCGEDVCCCLDPQPNVVCAECGSVGGWFHEGD